MTMQNLGLILATLYPNADPLVDYRVQDDGAGPYIAYWNEQALGPQPDTATLQAAEAAAVAAAEAIQARRETDLTEEQQAKIDAQIQSDLNMTPAEVNSTVDSVFAGFTAGQRTFLKRLVRMVLASARKVLR